MGKIVVVVVYPLRLAGRSRNRGSKLYDACGNQLSMVRNKRGGSDTDLWPPPPRSSETVRSTKEAPTAAPRSILKRDSSLVVQTNRRSLATRSSSSVDTDPTEERTPSRNSSGRPMSTVVEDKEGVEPGKPLTTATRTGRLLQRVNSVKKKSVKPTSPPPVQPKSPPPESPTKQAGSKAVKKARGGKRGEREVLLTSETIREHEETVNNSVETKSRKFMKKLFAM